MDINTDKLMVSKQYSVLATNLKTLMEQGQVTLSMLHKSTGIPLATISRLLSDEQQNPTIASLVPLAKFFQVSLDQLIGSEPLPSLIESSAQSANKWHSIPLISWEYIMKWTQEKHHKIHKYAHNILTDLELSQDGFALLIEHNDWQFFPQGTLLIIEPHTEPKHRDYIIIAKTELKNGLQSATLRQLLIDGNEKYLKPLNPEFKIAPLTEEDKILGVMKQSRRDY